MKVRFYSDLHVEFIEDYRHIIDYNLEQMLYNKDADAVVLAGDIAQGEKLFVKTLNLFAKNYKYVVAVKGNHDYWGTYVDRSVPEGLASNVYLLQDEAVTLDGVKFYGTTLWSDLGKGNSVVVSDVKRYINDFRRSKNHTVLDHIRLNQEARAKMQQHKDADVVVTHFPPNIKPGNNLSCYYGNTDLELFGKAWVYGHRHETHCSVVGETTLLANAVGYPMDGGTPQPTYFTL